MEEHSCQFTIDTGSNISIIRPDILPEQQQQTIQPVSQSFRTVTGEKAPILGKGDLRVRIGSQEVVHPMWIADIQGECILGLDFLELHGCGLDLRDSVLYLNGDEIPLLKTEEGCSVASAKTYRAVLDTTISLPPHSECVAPARVEGLQSSELRCTRPVKLRFCTDRLRSSWSHPRRMTLGGGQCSDTATINCE